MQMRCLRARRADSERFQLLDGAIAAGLVLQPSGERARLVAIPRVGEELLEGVANLRRRR